jgi:hypothetical protein
VDTNIQRIPENRKLLYRASVYSFTFIIWKGVRRVVSYFWFFPVCRVHEVNGCLPAISYILLRHRILMYELAGDLTKK